MLAVSSLSMIGTRLYARVAEREHHPGSVARPKVLVIYEVPENDPMRFLLEGISAEGKWYPDTIHERHEDAQRQAELLLGDAVGEWREVPANVPDESLLEWALNQEAAINTLCPVCGYDLGFEAWTGDSQSDEICPSCGIQFGYQDALGRTPEEREPIYAEWRHRWIDQGAQWQSVNPPHEGWDPREQLKRLGPDRQLPDDSIWYKRYQNQSPDS